MVNYPSDVNMTNITGHIAEKVMYSYERIFGEFSICIMLLFIAAAVYKRTNDKAVIALYFVTVGVIFGPVLNLWVASLFSLIAGVIVTLMIIERFFSEKI